VRLLFVSHSVPAEGLAHANIGGMQRVASDLYAALKPHPQVSLQTLLLRTSWRWTHVKTPPFLASLLWRIPDLVRTHRIEVVLYSSMVTASVTAALGERLHALGTRSAAIAHGRDVTLPNPFYQRFLPHVLASLDAVLPVSRATGEACIQRGSHPDKLHVVPNGIDTSRFSLPGDRRQARRALLDATGGTELPDRAMLLCSTGRQVQRKGFAWFVDQVMPRLPEDVHYWLAGEGPEVEHIHAAIGAHGLQDRVRLLGKVPEETLHRLYQGADLFVMPNIPVPGDIEGFGVVMLEAGLCGLPTVAASLEGIRDVIAEGENGHLVQHANPAAYVDAILPYYQDRGRLREIGLQTAGYVERTFGWPHIADRYVEVLRRLR
jgi:phosphatidyl-myo-inositol dimannoside synthase